MATTTKHTKREAPRTAVYFYHCIGTAHQPRPCAANEIAPPKCCILCLQRPLHQDQEDTGKWLHRRCRHQLVRHHAAKGKAWVPVEGCGGHYRRGKKRSPNQFEHLTFLASCSFFFLLLTCCTLRLTSVLPRAHLLLAILETSMQQTTGNL